MLCFILQEIRKAVSNEKKSNPSVSTHSPAQRPHTPTHPHTSFPPKCSPSPAEPVSRQHFSLASPVSTHHTSPASPNPAPIPPSTSPLCRQTHFLHIHHMEIGCVFRCQNTQERPRQQRLDGCTELPVFWWLAQLAFVGRFWLDLACWGGAGSWHLPPTPTCIKWCSARSLTLCFNVYVLTIAYLWGAFVPFRARKTKFAKMRVT